MTRSKKKRKKCDKNWQVEKKKKVDRLLFYVSKKVDWRFFRVNAHDGIENRRSKNNDISMNMRDIVEKSNTNNKITLRSIQ